VGAGKTWGTQGRRGHRDKNWSNPKEITKDISLKTQKAIQTSSKLQDKDL